MLSLSHNLVCIEIAMENIVCEELDCQTQAKLRKLFTCDRDYARFGVGRYMMPIMYKDHAQAIRHYEVHLDDIWVVTFPRTGTTWTQELAWLLANDLDYDRAASEPLTTRFAFLELPGLIPPKLLKDLRTEEPITVDTANYKCLDYTHMIRSPSRRHFKTHLPLSLLPISMLEKGKVIYVARDPRDVVVSFYHHNKLFKDFGYVGDFKEYWNLFKNDLLLWTPYFSHMKEAWEKRHHPNMMFIFYEELSNDLPRITKNMADFLGKKYTDKQILEICNHLQFDKMKENKSTHPEWMIKSDLINKGAQNFFRKGKVGGWREYFDEEMTKEAQEFIDKNLQNTDFRFPSIL